jgi:putative ABC transport system permease protein
MWKDMQFTLRAVGRRPLLALVVVATLALGIGGSTAIFSVFNAVLLRKLPYPDPDQIYLMNSVTPDGSPRGGITPVELKPFYEAEDHLLVEAAALAWSQEVQIIGSDGKAHSTSRYGVTDRFFKVFGTQLQLGKPFAKDQMPGVIVITYPIWRDVFASDPNIIGKSVQAEGMVLPVVGVTRSDFDFPENPGYFYLMRLGTFYDRVRAYRGFIRLRPECTGEQLQREVSSFAGKLGLDPATNRPSILVVRPFLEYVVGDLRPTVTILFGATAILLLIACINVTNLLLSQTTVRAREMALREALGAGRGSIIRQILTESLFLTVAGGALGSACAAAGVRILLRIAPPGLPRLDRVPIDSTVLLFAMGVTVLTGFLVGLAPAWRLSRNPLRSLVNEGGRGASGGPAWTRLFSALVVVEIALAVLLAIGAGLLVRSYFNLSNTDPGFNSDQVLTFFMNVPGRTEISFKPNPGGKPEIKGSYAPMADFFRELLERIKGLPGVKYVATTTNLPLDRYQYGGPTLFNLPDQPGANSKATAQSAVTESVSPDYFHALKIRLLAGRALLSTDRPGSPGVAVVNQVFVRRFLSGQNPLGQRIRFPENRYVVTDTGFQFSHRTVDELEIVGVVGDVRYRTLGDPPEPRIYLSSEQWITRHRTAVIHATIDNPEKLIAPIRKEIASMDRLLNAEFAVYPSIVRGSLARERLATTLLVIFGLIALVLAAVGIYGLMAYSVAQRTGEIAVRSAMGASASQVMTLVMGRGARLALAGVVLGVIGAVALRQVVASQLYGVTAVDVRVFLLASAVLFGVAVLACFVPAKRAASIDPAELLRSE